MRRTDTTLDLSQKAEKGKSLLRLSADFCRFGGPQAMTLSRQFYDPGEGAAKRRRLARAWAPRGRRAHFLGLRIAVGLPRRPCARARQPRRGRRREEPKGCPGARWSAPRHALGCPCALGCFRLAASLLFALWSAAFTSRSLAAAPPPRASSRKDCHRTALRRRRDQTNAARIAQRDPGTTKDKRVQPATAAAHTTHLT